MNDMHMDIYIYIYIYGQRSSNFYPYFQHRYSICMYSYITVDPLLGHSYLAAQFYHVEEPWSATCQHLRSHERIIIVVWEANQKGTRCMGIWKPLMEERLWQLEQGVLFRVRQRYFEKEAGCRVGERFFFGWLFLQVERKRQESKGFWREAEGGVEKGVSIREIAERD